MSADGGWPEMAHPEYRSAPQERHASRDQPQVRLAPLHSIPIGNLLLLRGRINRSRVITEVEPWYNQSFLVPHEAIRYWMEKMDHNVAKNEGFDIVTYPWKADNFFTFYREYFYPFVHHHHGIEEEIVTPWFAKKGLTFGDKVMHEHVALMQALDKVLAMEQEYYSIVKAGGGDKDDMVGELTQQLKGHILHMNSHMRDHLQEEEELYPPALRDNIPQKDFQALEAKIVKSFSLADSKKALPCIVHCIREWGGEANVKRFGSGIPGPIRCLMSTNWIPAFYSYTEPLIDSLLLTTKPELKRPSKGSCCTIS